jgi:glycolate oxidase
MDGSVVEYGSREPDVPGYDMLGLLTGSEGTLALVTKIGVRLMRKPEAIRTMLAIYNSTDDAAGTVATLTARGIIPVAVEMLDGPMLRMVEEATHAGYPLDAAAVLLIEVEGLLEEADEQMWLIKEICFQQGAREVKVAQSEEERLLLWKGRKNAFGAIGRVRPTYYVQDGVVPRMRVAETLRVIDEIGKRYGIAICNVFHAGDGNMHPILPFDPRIPGDLKRAQQAGDEILAHCIAVGGSITGEHGVGMEKNEMMSRAFPEETLDLIREIKNLFDPSCSLNPGKVLPTGKGCLEIRQKPNQVL